jgi:hypothetical protein
MVTWRTVVTNVSRLVGYPIEVMKYRELEALQCDTNQ